MPALKTKHKYLLILLILAILIGGGAFIWQYLGSIQKELKETRSLEEKISPPSKALQMENWKTYRNKKYGFEFKYPPIPDCGFCRLDRADKEGFVVNRTSLNIENLEGLSLAEFVEKEMKNFKVEAKNEFLIKGRKAVSVSYRFGGMNRYGQVTFVQTNDKVIIVSFTAGVFCCSKRKEIYELQLYGAILSTLKFLR